MRIRELYTVNYCLRSVSFCDSRLDGGAVEVGTSSSALPRLSPPELEAVGRLRVGADMIESTAVVPVYLMLPPLFDKKFSRGGVGRVKWLTSAL